MNNGPEKSNQNARTVATVRGRRPAVDIKLATNDGVNTLNSANISGVKTSEAALDYASKVGLFTQGDTNDPEILGTKLLYSMLLAARRIQDNTQDRAAQDCAWAIRFIYSAVHETWRAQTETLRSQLAAANQEIAHLKATRWDSEPALDTNALAAAVMTRVQGAIQAQFATFQKSTTPDASKLDTLHQRISILDTTVKDVGSAIESISKALSAKPSYAAAATANAPPMQEQYAGRTHSEQDALARTELQDRRLLIIADSTLQNEWLNNTMPQLIAKAVMGIEKAFAGSPPLPAFKDLDSVSPRHAFRAGKSGVVLSFDSRAVVDWLVSPDVWQLFASQFEGEIRARPRLFEILLRNIPLTVDPTSPGFLETLTKENALPDNWIDSIKWMKPASRRADTQRSAHAMMAFRSADAANEVLDRGFLLHEGSTYRVERLLRDSPRCAKCQRHGHFANKCRRELACGRCAGTGHHANSCEADSPKCATCSSLPNCDADHPAWARECPARLRALERMQSSNPEDFLPRFLTAKSATAAFKRQAAPLADVVQHRAPAVASGAHKYHKPAEAPNNQRKRPGKDAATPATGSRPSTPLDGQSRGRRSRAASTASGASEASGASRTTKKQTTKKRNASASISSVGDVEAALSTQPATH